MIGILDSGICGLAIAREVARQLPGHPITYFGDTARMPYGGRHPDTLREYAAQGAQFLVDEGAEVLVVACHTLASAAGSDLLDRLDIPVLLITDATAMAVRASAKASVGVLGTRTTIDSRAHEDKIKAVRPGVRVYGVAAPLLVPFVEEGRTDKPETAMLAKKYIHPLKVRKVDTLVLGCTHLIFLRKIIQRKVGRRVALVDGVLPLACEVKRYVEIHPEAAPAGITGGSIRVCVSEKTAYLENTARVFFHGNVTLTRVRLPALPDR